MSDFEAARRAMVDCQVRPSDVTRYAIIEAMLAVPREKFVPRSARPVAYAGSDVPLGNGRVLLDPRSFAKMLEAADIGPDDVVLDVACGSGYSTAVLGHMAATIVAVEGDEALAESARRSLGELEIHNTVVEHREPASGAPEAGLYDAILINGGVERIPEALSDQLKPGGRLVAIFMEGQLGQCRLVTRPSGSASEALTARRVFDAGAPLLPGFEAPQGFSF